MLPSSSATKSSAKNSTASDLLPSSDRLSLTRSATPSVHPHGRYLINLNLNWNFLDNYQDHSTSTTSSNHNIKISFSLLDTHVEGLETSTGNKSAREVAALEINRLKKKSWYLFLIKIRYLFLLLLFMLKMIRYLIYSVLFHDCLCFPSFYSWSQPVLGMAPGASSWAPPEPDQWI